MKKYNTELFDSFHIASDPWNNNNFETLSDAIGGYEKSAPLLATSAWQAILESPDFNNKIYPKINKRFSGVLGSYHLEKYILSIGKNKYALMVFDPSLETEEPIIMDASKHNTKKSINSGYGMWHSKISNSISNQQSLGMFNRLKTEVSGMRYSNPIGLNSGLFDPKVFDEISPKLIQEGIKNSEWPMVIMKPPKKTFTKIYPAKSHQVKNVKGQNLGSLAGVYAYNNKGEFGATVALHSFPNSYVEIGKTKVFIEKISGTVVSVHNVSDSCFVKLNATELEIEQMLQPIKGPLTGTSPRQYEACSFTNKSGKKIETMVTGWSPDINYFEGYNQVKVLTNPNTNPGDSGAALIDSEKNVLGFSFYRTEVGAPIEFSAWIWAASVFKAHNIIY